MGSRSERSGTGARAPPPKNSRKKAIKDQQQSFLVLLATTKPERRPTELAPDGADAAEQGGDML